MLKSSSLKAKIIRFLLVVAVATVLLGTPSVPKVLAADCVSTSGSTCSG